MKMFNESTALKLMRAGKCLVAMHTRNGARWFLSDGQVSNETAQALVARPDIEVSDGGLFVDCAQTYRSRNHV
jgi:hypothetical protein